MSVTFLKQSVAKIVNSTIMLRFRIGSLGKYKGWSVESGTCFSAAAVETVSKAKHHGMEQV